MLERFLDQIGEVLRLCEDTDGILVVNREGIIEYHRIPLNSYWCSQDTVGRHILELYPELDGESSTIRQRSTDLRNLFGLPYVVMRKPAPIDTTTLNYNWQIWETNAFSIYPKETDEVDEQSAQEAVAAVLRYLSRVGLLRYHCHSGYLSTVVQENEMSNVLTPAGGIFRRFVEPGQEVEYGQKIGVILDPFTAEVEAEITCPTSGVVFFALKKPLTTEHEVAFKAIRRLHGGCL